MLEAFCCLHINFKVNIRPGRLEPDRGRFAAVSHRELLCHTAYLRALNVGIFAGEWPEIAHRHIVMIIPLGSLHIESAKPIAALQGWRTWDFNPCGRYSAWPAIVILSSTTHACWIFILVVAVIDSDHGLAIVGASADGSHSHMCLTFTVALKTLSAEDDLLPNTLHWSTPYDLSVC